VKHTHSVLRILHTIGNLLLVVLLFGLVTLPGASFGLIKMDEGKVLSSQSVRLNITLDDLNKNEYVYDKESDSIIKKEDVLPKRIPVQRQTIQTSTAPVENYGPAEVIETIETQETTEEIEN
jgi:hypothetical protein